MKAKPKQKKDELRVEYDFDFTQAVRGKYHKRLQADSTNIVVLDPDVAKLFRSSAAVNDALRALIQTTELTRRVTAKSGKRTA